VGGGGSVSAGWSGGGGWQGGGGCQNDYLLTAWLLVPMSDGRRICRLLSGINANPMIQPTRPRRAFQLRPTTPGTTRLRHPSTRDGRLDSSPARDAAPGPRLGAFADLEYYSTSTVHAPALAGKTAASVPWERGSWPASRARCDLEVIHDPSTLTSYLGDPCFRLETQPWVYPRRSGARRPRAALRHAEATT